MISIIWLLHWGHIVISRGICGSCDIGLGMICAFAHLLDLPLPEYLFPEHLVPHPYIFLYRPDALLNLLLPQPRLHMRVLTVPVYLWPVLQELHIFLLIVMLSLLLLLNSHAWSLLCLFFNSLSLLHIDLACLLGDLWSESRPVRILKLLKVLLPFELVLKHSIVETTSDICALLWTKGRSLVVLGLVNIGLTL